MVWGSASSSSREHHCFPQVPFFFFSFVTTIAMNIDCILPWPSLFILQGVFFDVRSLILSDLGWSVRKGLHLLTITVFKFSQGQDMKQNWKVVTHWKKLCWVWVRAKWQLFAPWVVSFSSYSFSKIYQVLINVVCSVLAGVLNHVINRRYSWLIRLNCLGCAIFSIYKISLHSLNILC